ncbi:MAG: UDP-N-acetylmuramoyl-L-alanine--D-glutamate ligase [Nitrospirae bacterium]|nr:UDP-N-acetylmuramoyl-L-alanine--D-glutamate ligase [Nitrospirota bacterium]
MEVRGKKVTVVGLGKSGLAAAQLLIDRGAEVTVTDKFSGEAIGKRAGKLKERGIKIEVGQHGQEAIEGADLIVVSPGVPPDSLSFTIAREKGIPLIGELELGCYWCEAPIIAITGTNGKSTTVTLIGEMLRAGGRRVNVAGNIGNPFCGEVGKLSKDVLAVVEVSSFQLETIKDFKPFIAVILNVSADHLDRYDNSFSRYLKVKQRLLSNQGTKDFAVLNADDDNLCKDDSSHSKAEAETFFFSRKRQLRKGVFVEEGKIIFREGGKSQVILACDELGIKGTHNLENALAATAVALICKVDPRIIAQVLTQFSGLPHRSEFVDEIGGVKFINDSKGTNVGAVVRCLEGLKGQIILIAGGRDKGGDYSILRELVEEKVKALILLGEVKDKIKKALAGTTSIKEVDSMEDAVRVSYSLAVKGETVLLSPACSSFDMFKDFEERGRVFKEAVGHLK